MSAPSRGYRYRHDKQDASNAPRRPIRVNLSNPDSWQYYDNKWMELRAQLGKTQEEISRRSGSDPSNWAHYESGRTNPKISALQAMAEGYGYDLILELRPKSRLADDVR